MRYIALAAKKPLDMHFMIGHLKQHPSGGAAPPALQKIISAGMIQSRRAGEIFGT